MTNEIETIAFDNGIFGAITYLVYDKKTLEGVLIDCTNYPLELQNYIQKNKIKIKYILITHGHFDHVYVLNLIKSKYPNTPIFIHKNDLPLLDNIEAQCSMAGVEGVKLPCVDALLDENTKNLKIANSEIKVISTPGHSKGSVCYLIENNLYSGDTLFRVSVGRCDLFGGSFEDIEKSIKNKLFNLPDDIKVYPGHGGSTTIGYEKQFNPYFGSNYS